MWLLNYFTIKRSSIFLYNDYMNTYMRKKRSHSLVLLHYIFIGERNGYIPNPFFDPLFFKKQSGTRSLARYLSNSKYWVLQTCPQFDGQWYAKQYCVDPKVNPLVHFWTTGMATGGNPSPDLDSKFLLNAVCRDHWDKTVCLFELFSDRASNTPLTAIALQERRNRFYSKIVLDVLCESKPKNRFLAFVQATSNYNISYLEGERQFDVLLNYYDGSDAVSPGVDYVLRQKGTKTTAIKTILEKRPEILMSYDAVLFLDDDIVISKTDIEKLFRTAAAFGLDLAQASLSSESECYFDELKQPAAGRGVKPLTAVEIMMPVISARALRRCGWVFGEGISGWSVDLLLSAKIREAFGNTIGLVADVVARHERGVDTANGGYYKFLKANGIDASIEAGDIAIRFDLDDSKPQIAIHHEPLNPPAPHWRQDRGDGSETLSRSSS